MWRDDSRARLDPPRHTSFHAISISRLSHLQCPSDVSLHSPVAANFWVSRIHRMIIQDLCKQHDREDAGNDLTPRHGRPYSCLSADHVDTTIGSSEKHGNVGLRARRSGRLDGRCWLHGLDGEPRLPPALSRSAPLGLAPHPCLCLLALRPTIAAAKRHVFQLDQASDSASPGWHRLRLGEHRSLLTMRRAGTVRLCDPSVPPGTWGRPGFKFNKQRCAIIYLMTIAATLDRGDTR